MLPLIYMSRMNVETEYLDTFIDWCKRRHWPDLVSVGFHSANGYLSSVGGPASCNVYEIPSTDVFSNDYAQIREVDEQLKIIVAEKISDHSLTVYEQVATHGLPPETDAGDDRPSLARSWSCPALSALRFDCATADDAAVVDVHTGEIFERLSSSPSFLRARLLREFAKHPTYPSPEPRWQLLVEWADVDAAAESEGEMAAPLAHRLGTGLDRLSFNAAGHLFSLRNHHGWRP